MVMLLFMCNPKSLCPFCLPVIFFFLQHVFCVLPTNDHRGKKRNSVLAEHCARVHAISYDLYNSLGSRSQCLHWHVRNKFPFNSQNVPFPGNRLQFYGLLMPKSIQSRLSALISVNLAMVYSDSISNNWDLCEFVCVISRFLVLNYFLYLFDYVWLSSMIILTYL